MHKNIIKISKRANEWFHKICCIRDTRDGNFSKYISITRLNIFLSMFSIVKIYADFCLFLCFFTLTYNLSLDTFASSFIMYFIKNKGIKLRVATKKWQQIVFLFAQRGLRYLLFLTQRQVYLRVIKRVG